MRDLPVQGPDPSAAHRQEHTLREGSFDRALELEEIVVMPDRLDPDEGGGVLEPRARFAVPREAIEQPAMHDVHTIDETALRVELGADAQDLRVITVGVSRAVIEGDVPQLTGPHAPPGAGRVLGPRTDELRRRVPELAPDESAIRAEHPDPRAAIDPGRVDGPHRRIRAEAAPPSQQIEEGVIVRWREGPVVQRTDVRDAGGPDFAGELDATNRRIDASRIDQRVRCIELLESFEEEGPLL